MSRVSRGIASPFAILFVPLGLAAVGAVGAAYGAAAALSVHWAIVNPPLLIMAVVGAGWLCIQTTRLAVLRNIWIAILLSFVAAGVAMWADAAAAYAVARLAPLGTTATTAQSAWQYLGERLDAGVSLVAGHVRVKGWLLLMCWIGAGFLLLCATMFTFTVEAGRPFCTSCRAWGWKPRWKFEMKGPSEEALARAEQSKSFSDLLMIRPAGSNNKKLRVRLGACNCGRLALVAADYVTISKDGESAASSLLDDHPATATTCSQLFAWAEGIDPVVVDRRPRLQLDRREAAPLEIPIRPESGEYLSSYRWNGSFGGGLFRVDNEYTRELRRRLVSGEFETAELAIRSQRHADDLAFVVEACADWTEPQGWLEDWARERPTSAAMHLVRGIQYTKWAWVARGSGWRPKDYGSFIDRLSMADEQFEAAAAAAGKDPTPWAWMVQTAKGLQLGEEEVRRRLGEATRRWPGHTAAYVLAVDALSPKWGGSAEAMLAVAREAMARAKPGSNAHVAITDAHIELAMTAARESKSAAAAEQYFANPQVAHEIRAANELCFRVGSHAMTMATPRSRVWFAYALWKSGSKEQAAEHLRIIGKSTPYDLFSRNLPFAKDTVKRARRECGV
jgi:hypothetical protein